MESFEEITRARLKRLPPKRQLDVWLAYHGWTRSDLAERLGVAKGTVSNLLRGTRTARPLVERIRLLSGIELGS